MIAGYDCVIASGKVVTNEFFISDFEETFNINRKWLYAGITPILYNDPFT